MYLFQIFALLALTVASGFGADATFPKDGQRVYLIQSDAPKLTAINIEKKSTSEIDLSRFTGEQPIRGSNRFALWRPAVRDGTQRLDLQFRKKSCEKLKDAL